MNELWVGRDYYNVNSHLFKSELQLMKALTHMAVELLEE